MILGERGIILVLISGMESNIEGTHGKMVCWGQIVLFLLDGIGHMSFKLRIRLVVFSTSLQQISKELQADMEESPLTTETLLLYPSVLLMETLHLSSGTGL